MDLSTVNPLFSAVQSNSSYLLAPNEGAKMIALSAWEPELDKTVLHLYYLLTQ